MSGVRCTHGKVIHFQVDCRRCDFSAAMGGADTEAKVTRAIRRHVAKTGHAVQGEKAYGVTYWPRP